MYVMESKESDEHKFKLENAIKAIAEEAKAPLLTDDQVKLAKRDLVVRYPRVKRLMIDPPLKVLSKKQKIGMFSWYPSKGAKPDINGVYGTIIHRGAFQTVEEAEHRSADLIRSVDSKHEYYLCHVGAEYPLSTEASVCSDIKLVEQNVDMAREEKERQDAMDKENAKRQIEERRKKLQDDAMRDPNEINLDYYATKKSILANTRQRLEDQLKEVQKSREIIEKTKKIIIDLDQSHPAFKDEFFEKMKATFAAQNIPVDLDKMKRYMDLDYKLVHA